MSQRENEAKSAAPEARIILHRIEFVYDEAYIRTIAWHAAVRRYGRIGIPGLAVLGVVCLGLALYAAQHRLSAAIAPLFLGIWLPMLPMVYYWQTVRFLRKISRKSLGEKLTIEFLEEEIRVHSPKTDSKISHDALLELSLEDELIVFGVSGAPFCVPRAAVDEGTLDHLLAIARARNLPVKRKD